MRIHHLILYMSSLCFTLVNIEYELWICLFCSYVLLINFFIMYTVCLEQVQFTRCLYAQLIQQKFQPDKRSGWVLPSTSNPKFKEQDLGMKLVSMEKTTYRYLTLPCSKIEPLFLIILRTVIRISALLYIIQSLKK